MIVIAAFLVISLSGYSQLPDSISLPSLPLDALLQTNLQTLDSIQHQSEQRFNELKQEYDSVEHAFTSITSTLQHQIDSLTNLNQPVEKLTAKLDCISNVKDQKLQGVKQKAEGVKQKAKEKINSLNLPDEVTQEITKYTDALDQLDITLPQGEFNFPELNLDKVADMSLPGIKNPLQGNLGNIDLSKIDGQIGDVTGKISTIQQEIPEAITVESLAQKAEEEAAALASERFGDMTGVPAVPASEEEAKEVIETEARKYAMDHFAGKEDKLQAAMDQMSKYKQKYANVQSIKDLPKRYNEMKDKPLRERLVPGLSIQIQKSNDWWFDFNPYVGYRFTSRITAGLGWNQRIAYNFDSWETNSSMKVYGPRSFGEFHIKKGFSARLEIETMNTPVRVPPKQDFTHREWVWGAMVGMKKDYKISKSLRGNAQILYNMFDPQYKSPYTERLNMRLGLEYSISKAKPKQKEI